MTAPDAAARGVRIERRAAGVSAIVLARPERLNALHGPSIAALASALAALAEDRDTRAVILSAEGPHFSAGGDLDWMSAEDGRALHDYHGAVVASVRALVTFPKPVVAVVRGACAGGAVGFALGADYVIAARDAFFGVQFLRIGLVPDCALTTLLARRVGLQRAKRLVLDDRRIDAAEAATLGLVDLLSAPDALDAEALQLATRLAHLPRQAFARTKGLFERTAGALDTLLEDERTAQAVCLGSDEFAEGVAAFRARRAPEFR
ncbi:MAG: enoyl-CoA hydratase/isomerase family protein [Gammaproteobacteria bacterium]|nr:enoyl-CoA hydratase/isomerase family protein [Gammaproteobacteria bacterium]